MAVRLWRERVTLDGAFSTSPMKSTAHAPMTSKKSMAGIAARLKGEVRKILVIAVYFSTGFCLIVLADRLITMGSGIETASFFRAVIGGLIVAKVLLIADLLPFVHAFPNKPLVQNIVWKSSIYVAASLVFRYLEPFIKYLFKGMGLSASNAAVLEEFAKPRFWAIEIWLAMLLVVFVTMQELSRVVGKEKLRFMFFGR
jgi:hypothetical protein